MGSNEIISFLSIVRCVRRIVIVKNKNGRFETSTIVVLTTILYIFIYTLQNLLTF